MTPYITCPACGKDYTHAEGCQRSIRQHVAAAPRPYLMNVGVDPVVQAARDHERANGACASEHLHTPGELVREP